MPLLLLQHHFAFLQLLLSVEPYCPVFWQPAGCKEPFTSSVSLSRFCVSLSLLTCLYSRHESIPPSMIHPSIFVLRLKAGYVMCIALLKNQDAMRCMCRLVCVLFCGLQVLAGLLGPELEQS